REIPEKVKMMKTLFSVLVLLSTTVVVAQQSSAGRTLSGPPSFKVPRTPDGQPDLQGYWTNLTYTPFERPKELANKAFYTEKEAIEAFNKAVAESQNQVVHYVNSDFGATPV